MDGLDAVIYHINRHGSHHSDAILTEDMGRARHFLREVNSSSVMINTSTRFSDGFEYGLGAEIGISTDDIHTRGRWAWKASTDQVAGQFGGALAGVVHSARLGPLRGDNA